MNWVIELSRQHKPKAGQANIYGVVVYTDRHVFVKKMLNDDDYWKALDEWSGLRWAVFATRAAQGKVTMPSVPKGMYCLMMPVWVEPRANQQLLEAFELDSTRGLPALVVFAEAPEGTLLKNVIPIDESSQEAAYKSLKDSFSTVANALDFMYDRYRREGARAFEVIDEKLENLKGWHRLRKTLNIIERMKALLC